MFPKSATGWIILILAVLILMYGVAGGFAVAGSLVHEAVKGLQSFGHNARGG